MKLLKELYAIHSPSRKEFKMIRFLANYCKRIPNTKVKIDKLGNIFVTKGKSETYPCLVAHTDQVQRLHPKDFVAIETRELIFGYSPSTRQQCGLGADDKNGIWIALKCLEKYPVIKTAFFVSEEIGCLGSEGCNMSFFDDCGFVIQCDRRGYKDLITEICGINLCSDEFLEDIHFQNFGYAKEHGLTTDVGTLKERQLPVSCINLSCGYYNPHSDEEITVKADLLNCLRFVESIIENCVKVYPHHWVDKYDDPYCCQYEYDDLYNELWEIFENNPDCCSDDLKACYQDFYPHISGEQFDMIFEKIKQEVASYKRYEQERLGKI